MTWMTSQLQSKVDDFGSLNANTKVPKPDRQRCAFPPFFEMVKIKNPGFDEFDNLEELI